MRHSALASMAAVLFAAVTVSSCGTPPLTLIERAVEARSSSDIVEDNRIVLEVNKIMADMDTIKASTEIYEQVLLITGIFTDQAMHDQFKRRVEAISGIKRLYWHATVMSEAEQKRNEANMLSWAGALALDAKIGARITATRGIADVNYRVAVDSFGTVYLLGRARSDEEKAKLLRVVRQTGGVKKVVDYTFIRP